MAEKKEEARADSPFIEVELIDTHTHQGKLCRKGEKISIRKRQLARLREWGKVK